MSLTENIWVLCSTTQVWHRLVLGTPPELRGGQAVEDPPMAKLYCDRPDVVGSWVFRDWEKDLPPMGAYCHECEIGWKMDLVEKFSDE